jgi:thiol:disulfide interchange protein DsbA
MKKFLFSSAAAALFAFSGSAMAAQFVAGKDYTVLPTPVAVEKPGKIEVREFFWYGSQGKD